MCRNTTMIICFKFYGCVATRYQDVSQLLPITYVKSWLKLDLIGDNFCPIVTINVTIASTNEGEGVWVTPMRNYAEVLIRVIHGEGGREQLGLGFDWFTVGSLSWAVLWAMVTLIVTMGQKLSPIRSNFSHDKL